MGLKHRGATLRERCGWWFAYELSGGFFELRIRVKGVALVKFKALRALGIAWDLLFTSIYCLRPFISYLI